MAAVLEEFLYGKVSSKSLVSWLSSNEYVIETENELFKERSLRAEFLPFFINYLRDQTSHLICHGVSSGASPAKTPASAQKFRRSSLQRQNSSSDGPPCQESGSRGPRHRPNRTQLFSPSPLRSDASEGTLTPKSLCSEEESPLSTSWDQVGQFYLKTPRDEYKGRMKRISPSLHKKDEQLTLGQYIKPDGFNLHQPKGRRRSDQHHLKENVSHKTPVNSKRRSGGKGNKTSYSDGSLKSKSKLVYQDQPTPEFVLNDSEDFPVVGAPTPITNIPTRRITPTALTNHRTALITRGKRQPSSTPVFTKSYQEEPPIPNPVFQKALSTPGDAAMQDGPLQSTRGLERERELLRLERLKQQANITNSSSNPHPGSSPLRPQTPTKSFSDSSAFSYPSELTKASKDEVTYRDYIDKLAELYSACTKECLMPNLTIELYFLVHLLTAKGSVAPTESINERTDPEDINYLCSIHNCVHFAASVLHQLFWLLAFLDKTTLKLLAELPHLSDFSPALKSQLELAIEGGSSRPIFVTIKSPVQAVPFLADKDNRTNFPSEVAFHRFKKQRDKFYEFVREWLDNHNIPGWSMHAAMSKRIRDLVEQVVTVANCTYFARLFCSQLTRMCQGDHLIADHRDNVKERGFLGNLKKTNPEKFKRLEERCFTPTTSSGPSPLPAFHGCQEFFKEFIIAADSFLLNQHLIDNFSSKVLELNEMQLGLTDQDGDSESNGVDDEVRSSFSSNLQAARVLAKFLGFLVFLPYQGGEALPESVQTDVVAHRNKLCPPVDILDSLRVSCCQHRLVMTVPWVVEYLSMMDPMAAQLDSFQVLLRLLVQVYRTVSGKLRSDPVCYNMLLVLLVLGWLFEIPGLPASMYFMSFSDDFILDDAVMQEAVSSASLDNLHLVDQQLLYLCCPYLGDIRVLLTDASLGFGSKTTPMKKITPIAAKTPSKPIQTVHQLQQDLEKNFFDNHSPSLKKTVDFVSSRLASNCIKHIDAKLITAARETAMGLLEAEIRSEEVGTVDEDWTSEMKRAILRRVKTRGEEVAVATREAAEEQATEFVLRRSRDALSLLLPQETSDQVLGAAAHITSRLAMERATRWISTQIQAAIQQELSTGIDRAIRAAKKDAIEKPKFTLPAHHDRTVTAPSAVLQQYKDMLRYLLTGSCIHEVTLDELANLVTVTQQVLLSRQDLTPVAHQMVQQLSIELVSALAIFKPAYLHSEIHVGCATHRLHVTEGHVERWNWTSGGDDQCLSGQFNLRPDEDDKGGGNMNGEQPAHVDPSEATSLTHFRNREPEVNEKDLMSFRSCSNGQTKEQKAWKYESSQYTRPVVNDVAREPSSWVGRTQEGLNTECLDLTSTESHIMEKRGEEDGSGICRISLVARGSGTPSANQMLVQDGSRHCRPGLNSDETQRSDYGTVATETNVSLLIGRSKDDQKPGEVTMTTPGCCNQTALEDFNLFERSSRVSPRTDSIREVSLMPSREVVHTSDSINAELPHRTNVLDCTEQSQAGEHGYHLERPKGSMSILEVFIELWRDLFKCQIPTQLFLCAKNALLIEQTPNPKECWDCYSQIVHTLVIHGLADSTKVIECITKLLQSKYVYVTEALGDAVWQLVQLLTQDDNLKKFTSAEASPDDLKSLLHILMETCPDGKTLKHLCDFAQQLN